MRALVTHFIGMVQMLFGGRKRLLGGGDGEEPWLQASEPVKDAQRNAAEEIVVEFGVRV
ncbi:MAG: hypothetical protein R3272_11415 [Candidatus Promineifilaceae bacterium]|nr:hypothetical protein [Candidatus Promineifilaceae bacterium]